MWSALVLALWLCVQPWLMWPMLPQDVSQRFTLVLCCVALGLLRFGASGPQHPLPRWLGWWGAALLVVMTSHHWHLVRDGGYFEFFQETVLFSDGVLVVVALLWGFWALRQLSWRWFQLLPAVGCALVSLNLVLALGQAAGLNWHLGTPHPVDLTARALQELHLSPYKPSGFLGLDRTLGAYAVVWLPILWVWKRWTVIVPLACVALASKVTAWIGVGVVCWWMLPRGHVKSVALALCAVAAVAWSDGELVKKVPMRLWTWWHTAQGVLTFWRRGVGFHPITSTIIRQRFGYALPGLHSDWLSLAFHAGALIALWAAGAVAWLARQRARTPMARALQASLLAVAVMSLGQSVVSRASLGGVVLMIGAWYLTEQEGAVA